MTHSTFNFWQHWYPISPIEDLDPNVPTPMVLLGHKIVVWKPAFSNQYAVFLDQCPHRLAPLSEGRIDETTGHLTCSYHGWQFDPQGICTRIPQAEDAALIAKNRDRYCATILPSQEANGLLWVWPDAESAAIAATQSLPRSPLVDADRGFVWSSIVRDLEYDWQTFIENVADPAHVPFAHHGIQGNRDRAQPIPIDIVQSDRNLIVAKIERGLKSKITFRPPCLLEYDFDFGQDRRLGLVTYCIPIGPGKSRLVAQFPRNFAKGLHRLIPRWWNHLFERNLVLDGDMILLYHQEREFQRRSQTQSWKLAYNMPTSADRLVIEFRRWVDLYCQGQMPWGNIDLSKEVSPQHRPQILDRYHTHTLICSSCRSALKNVHRMQMGLLIYVAIALAIAVVIPDAQRLWVSLPLALSGLFGLGLYGLLKYGLEPKFYFIDYIHAKR